MLARAPRPAPSARAVSGTGITRFLGPGLLVSVGYMDPGNWATDIEAGSRLGYGLLFVVVTAGLAALFLQTRAARLGLATGRDLARLCRDEYAPVPRRGLFAAAIVAIVACDIAEVLGAALALKLLFGLPLWAGVLLTGFDTLLILWLRGRGMARLQAIVFALVATIAVAFVVELLYFPPDWSAVALGLIPDPALASDARALTLAVGIIGATVMPHNLYLHSAIVRAGENVRAAARGAGVDAALALTVAMFVNAAILITAASAFHGNGALVTEIDDAYRLLAPMAGTALAATIFGVALLAAGQSSTITGTLAAGIVLEGFLEVRWPEWALRLSTRAMALVPALAGVLWMGDGSVGRLLVLSQVVLSLQLPFALWPMLRMTGQRHLMGDLADSAPARVLGWTLFALIVGANVWMLSRVLE